MKGIIVRRRPRVKHHRCRKPSAFWRRLGPGSEWRCTCGVLWRLKVGDEAHYGELYWERIGRLDADSMRARAPYVGPENS